MGAEPTLSTRINDEELEFTAIGSWTTAHADALEVLVAAAAAQASDVRNMAINMAMVGELDTLGAWLLERLARNSSKRGRQVRFVGLPDHYRGLLDEVRRVNRRAPASPEKKNRLLVGLDILGRGAVDIKVDLVVFLEMVAALSIAIAHVLVRPRNLRLTSAVYHLYRVGWQAVPIILLSTFMIGAILAQQGIFHFRTFGADVFVVDMVSILVLREVGVLIVCVMVAGRSGSAYTAEIGSMKMREEIDALRTMGLDPIQVLVLPRIIALVIAVPLLTFIGSMAALYGAGLVCWLYGGMAPDIFLERLREAISLQTFAVGMIKAPFMALTIGLVACVEGFEVEGSAASLGLKTTASVVKSIFLVIALDGLFAMFFAGIGM